MGVPQITPKPTNVALTRPLAATAKDLETPHEAATNLEFEKAKLRDAVKRLHEIELATLTGEVNYHRTAHPHPTSP